MIAPPFNELSGKRVLILDDCDQITSLLDDVFAAHGAKVAVSNSGRMGMLMLQLNAYDLLLLDLHMPGLSGWDVLKFIRTVCPQMLKRTLVLTGDQYRTVGYDRLRRWGVHIVFKPFDVDVLRRHACDVLQRAEAVPAA